MQSTAVKEEVVLTANDRCDACSAAAQVVATFLNGPLYFCGHHARKSIESITAKAINLHDPDNQLSLFKND